MTLDTARPRRRFFYALIALIVFALAENVVLFLLKNRNLYSHYRVHPYAMDAVFSCLRLALVALGLFVCFRPGLRQMVRMVGGDHPVLLPLAVAFVSTLPMLIGYALISKPDPQFTFLDFLDMVAISPFVEEVLFRGYLFRQLYEFTRLPFWLAVTVSAVAFGAVHAFQISSRGEVLQVAEEILITGLAGAFLAWLYKVWGFNLWIAYFVHFFMNFWWLEFGISDIAIGPFAPSVLRIFTVALAITLTIYLRFAGSVPVVRKPPGLAGS